MTFWGQIGFVFSDIIFDHGLIAFIIFNVWICAVLEQCIYKKCGVVELGRKMEWCFSVVILDIRVGTTL